MKPNETRLVLEIDRNIHRSMKMVSASNHMTMKNWIIMLVARELREEEKREKENVESFKNKFNMSIMP
jgi:hypothetical protein